MDGDGREKCVSADRVLYSRFGANKAGTKNDWRCYADFLTTSEEKGCVSDDGSRTSAQCRDADPSNGNFCTRKEELLAIRNAGCTTVEPTSCGPNEVMDCPINCERNCGDQDAACVAVQCLIADTCACENGYFRNDDGVCVTAAECDGTPVCGTNEVWNECGGCDRRCDNAHAECAA